MKRRSLLAMILSLVMCLGIAMPAWAAESENLTENTENDFADLDSKYDTEFFNRLRLDVIEEELQDHSIIARNVNLIEMIPATLSGQTEISGDDMFCYAEDIVLDSSIDAKEKKNLLEKINNIKTIPVTYVDFENGRVYDSEKGYIGEVQDISTVPFVMDNDITEIYGEDGIAPMSKDNPTVSEIFGGNTGAFERRQLGYGGFDKIIADVTLPTISNITDGEQAWVYYGFEAPNVTGIEGGFAYQKGNEENEPRWLPFIKSGDAYTYAEKFPFYSGDTIKDVSFFLKKSSTADANYTAYLYGPDYLHSANTGFNNANINGVSVKRMTSIGKTSFYGSNISTKSLNQKYANVFVKRYYENNSKAWSSYSEYSNWKNNQWYGTIDCTNSYIHRSGSYVSIYK